LVLTEEERQELQQMTQSRMLPAGDVMRSRMVLLLADGVAYQKIQELLNPTAPTIARWKRRSLQHRIAGLMDELHPGQPPSVRVPKLEAKVLGTIKEGPKDGTTHWSCRKLASRFHASKDTIQRILAQADVRPHRMERHMASDDPDFESKAAFVIGLCLAPPQHAAVFVDFLEQVVSGCEPQQEIHIILDNLSAHKTSHVEEYLRRNPTPSCNSRPPILPGSIKSRSGLRVCNAKSLLVASSLRSRISYANSCAMFPPVPKPPASSNGNTPTFRKRILPC
jgi:transposase